MFLRVWGVPFAATSADDVDDDDNLVFDDDDGCVILDLMTKQYSRSAHLC